MNKVSTRQIYPLLKKTGIVVLLAFLTQYAAAQQSQQILLLADTFNSANTSDIFFDQPGVGANFGSNDWVINNNYNGAPVYPNTPSEDSVVGGLGQITGAPYSTYLHIHDVADPSGVANANWNPAHASDRFCYMSSSFCTAGLTNVSFQFFWTGQGDSTAYGRVYYSTDGGVTWTQTGRPKYNNEADWAFESLQNANFNNQQNLQFGFRWVNTADTTHDISWGIADVIAVGTYNSDTNNAATFNIISVTPDSVCQDGSVNILFSLTPALCYGNYEAYLSDSVGSFANPQILQYPFTLDASSTVWQTSVNIPNNVEGNCFRITIKRIGPPPLLQSDTSLCFKIQHCPVSIITNSAPVLTDADTACLKSAIDVYFNSFGNFNSNNVYYAQLSDSNGSFAHPDTIGHLTSNQAYPAMPGDVSGLIPTNVPPGCGYYVRIVSSNPGSVGTTIGPFCLTKCDVTTNNTIDLHACINYPYPTDTLTFKVTTDQWNQGASYDTCNNWTIELLDMMTFNIVNIGGLGVYHDSVSGTFTLIIGPASTLPVAPGTYYMRIISNCSNEPWNETGTVIRITIGEPSATPPDILSTTGDSIYCNTTSMELYVSPYNPNSNYFWNSNVFNPIESPAIIVDLNGLPPNNWVAYVREQNYGCFGPTSAPYRFVTTAIPTVKISGPTKVCLGDTAIFDATYFPATGYFWNFPPQVKKGVQSNTQIGLIFDTLGTFVINENSVNMCGGAYGNDTIKVFQLFDVNAKPNKTVCFGDSVSLTGVVPPYPRQFISLDSSTISNKGGMFNLHVYNDVIIDSFAVTFRSHTGTAQTDIYCRPGSYRGYEQSGGSWTPLALNTHVVPSSHANVKTVIPVELNKTIQAGDTVAFYITANISSAINLAIGNGIGIQQGIVYKSDGIIDFIQGTQNAFSFGASNGPNVLDVTIYYRTLGGLHYLWNNGDTTATITFVPTQSAQYKVRVYDTTGCTNTDSVLVTVDTVPHVYAGPDTVICPKSNYVMQATASPTATLSWTPAAGLSEPTAVTPTVNISQPTNFVLTAVGTNGCPKSDSVFINVYPLSVNAGPDTVVCAEETYVLQGVASTDSFEWYPATGLSAANVLNPTFSFNQTTEYYLVVRDTNGCQLKDSVVITVEYCNSYIKAAQAFTPNGDGVNDFFTVFGKYISTYQIRVYNRWGEEVYSSNDPDELNNLSKGWDGTYKGKLQDVGTFVYYIEAKDLNGNNIFEKGNVTLIR